MPKKFYLNNRNGGRSSRADELKSKQAMCVVHHHVHIVYSFRTEKSVSQRLSWALSHPVGAFSFSQKNTEEQNTQRSIKIAAPPPSPPPKGRGVITEIPLWAGCRLLLPPYWYLHWQ